MIQIVLISGRQGSGKTTLQQTLIHEGRRHFDFVWDYNFADPLYKLHDYIQNKMEFEFDTPRQTHKDGVLLQLLGTEWGRKVHGDNVWCEILKKRIEKMAAAFKPEKKLLFVIGDCRFRNEFDYFEDALRIRMMADEECRKERTDSWRDNTLHQSEIDLDLYQESGLFDLYLYTDKKHPYYVDKIGASSLVLAQLMKNTWKEKRNEKIERKGSG